MTQDLPVTNPYTGETLNRVSYHTYPAALEKLQAMHQLHHAGTVLPLAERISLLRRLAALMEEKQAQLVATALNEGGKPHKDTVVEVQRAISGVQWLAGALQQEAPQGVPMGLTPATAHRLAFSYRQPAGVVLAISAFNHPLNLAVHQMLPAVAVGAPVLLKPALSTPGSALMLLELLRQAGLPTQWAEVLILPDEHTARLAADPRVAYVSFIGSPAVGFVLKQTLASGTRCSLEHGGAAPVVAHHTADPQLWATPLARSAFYHAGQVCVSTQRLWVPRTRMNEWADALTKATGLMVTGNPTHETTDVGPMIRPAAVQRTHQRVQQATAAGASLLAGGAPLNERLYPPTLLAEVPQAAALSQEEIFGPVLCLYGYDEMAQAVAAANDVPYAFQAAVLTQDVDNALQTARQLKGTTALINDLPTFRADWMPFGGYEQSGYGMGGLAVALEEYSRRKLIILQSPHWA